MSIINTINSGFTERYAAIGFIHLEELNSLKTIYTIGSLVGIIETGDYYILDNNRVWCKLVRGAGSQASSGQGLHYVIVDTLPAPEEASENVIYMIQNGDNYDCYIKSNMTLIKISSTMPIPDNIVTTPDLEDYVLKTSLTDGTIDDLYVGKDNEGDGEVPQTRFLPGNLNIQGGLDPSDITSIQGGTIYTSVIDSIDGLLQLGSQRNSLEIYSTIYGPLKTNKSTFTLDNELVSKKYVDDAIAASDLYVKKTGDTMTGELAMQMGTGRHLFNGTGLTLRNYSGNNLIGTANIYHNSIRYQVNENDETVSGFYAENAEIRLKYHDVNVFTVNPSLLSWKDSNNNERLSISQGAFNINVTGGATLNAGSSFIVGAEYNIKLGNAVSNPTKYFGLWSDSFNFVIPTASFLINDSNFRYQTTGTRVRNFAITDTFAYSDTTDGYSLNVGASALNFQGSAYQVQATGSSIKIATNNATANLRSEFGFGTNVFYAKSVDTATKYRHLLLGDYFRVYSVDGEDTTFDLTINNQGLLGYQANGLNTLVLSNSENAGSYKLFNRDVQFEVATLAASFSDLATELAEFDNKGLMAVLVNADKGGPIAVNADTTVESLTAGIKFDYTDVEFDNDATLTFEGGTYIFKNIQFYCAADSEGSINIDGGLVIFENCTFTEGIDIIVGTTAEATFDNCSIHSSISVTAATITANAHVRVFVSNTTVATFNFTNNILGAATDVVVNGCYIDDYYSLGTGESGTKRYFYNNTVVNDHS